MAVTADLGAEAARLASGTLYSHAQWLSVLVRLGDLEQREELISVIREAAVVAGASPSEISRILLGDETSKGALSAYADHRAAMRRIVTADGISADELPALADGILGLAADDDVR
jgi:hypothetical protein